MGEPNPAWGPIKKIPAVRRGTHRRRARTVGMHMGTFWAATSEDRQIMYQVSKAGRR